MTRRLLALVVGFVLALLGLASAAGPAAAKNVVGPQRTMSILTVAPQDAAGLESVGVRGPPGLRQVSATDVAAETATSAGGLGARFRALRANLGDDTSAISFGGRYTEDQDAVIQLAKQAKRRRGVSLDDANTLADWADETGLPGHGPAVHPWRPGFGGQVTHINVGPVKHIPVIP